MRNLPPDPNGTCIVVTTLRPGDTPRFTCRPCFITPQRVVISGPHSGPRIPQSAVFMFRRRDFRRVSSYYPGHPELIAYRERNGEWSTLDNKPLDALIPGSNGQIFGLDDTGLEDDILEVGSKVHEEYIESGFGLPPVRAQDELVQMKYEDSPPADDMRTLLDGLMKMSGTPGDRYANDTNWAAALLHKAQELFPVMQRVYNRDRLKQMIVDPAVQITEKTSPRYFLVSQSRIESWHAALADYDASDVPDTVSAREDMAALIAGAPPVAPQPRKTYSTSAVAAQFKAGENYAQLAADYANVGYKPFARELLQEFTRIDEVAASTRELFDSRIMELHDGSYTLPWHTGGQGNTERTWRALVLHVSKELSGVELDPSPENPA